MSTEGTKRDFLTLDDVKPGELLDLLSRGSELKAARRRGDQVRTLSGKVLGTVYEKASTRTRISFDVAMYELGGHSVDLSLGGSQIARGEPLQDTARVLGGYCHALLIRTFAQARAEELAKWAPVPVINGLTDQTHPCQLVADLMTVHELRGDVRSVRYAWIGDGNNMAHSWITAAGLLGLDLMLACPDGFQPDPDKVEKATARIERLGRGRVQLVTDPAEAAEGADVVSTDVWASMGQEEESQARIEAFAGYCVNDELMAVADPSAIVLHCLPAHREEEISTSVLEGPQSEVWRQAENRLHAQKAVLELLLVGP